MGAALMGFLLGLNPSEREALNQDQVPFGVLRKIVAASRIVEVKINEKFDDDANNTADRFESIFTRPGKPYYAGLLTPALLGYDPTAGQDWEARRVQFEKEAPEIYRELTDVIAFLLKLSDDSTASRKGCKIKFKLKEDKNYSLEYNIGTVGLFDQRIRARIKMKGPIFQNY